MITGAIIMLVGVLVGFGMGRSSSDDETEKLERTPPK